MATERDIWASANLLLHRYGNNAEFHAAQSADELAESGDLESSRVWRRILDAIRTLQQDKPDGEPTH